VNDLTLTRVIVQNVAYIGAAFTILAALGWLWFRPGGPLGLPNDAKPLARVALYPVLGWMVVVIGASWLRILALPFSKSSPWLLAFLLLVPSAFWLWRLRKPDARSNPIAFLAERCKRVWVLLVPCVLGVVLINRLTVPQLYDVGRWGYDQVNYIHIADQYLDDGMLVIQRNGENILEPWLAASIRFVSNVSSGKLSKYIMDAPDNPRVSTGRAWLGLNVRNGGAAVDGCFGTWLGLDGIQAYVLSVRMQFLLLVCCGLWIALQTSVAAAWLLLIPGIASLWPSVILPSLFDNRDQTYAFILIFIILGSSVCGGLNRQINGVALGALTFIYVEIVPIVMILWTAFRIDDRPLLAGIRNLFVEGFVGLLVTLPFLPFNISYLIEQLRERETLRLEAPLGHLLGPLSPISGAFAGMGFSSSQLLPVILSISAIAFLVFQVLGLARWLNSRRYLSVAAFVALAVLASSLYMRDYQYVTYKFLTVLFPVAVLLCAAALAPSGAHRASFLWFDYQALLSPKTITLLSALCVPAIIVGAAMRSGFVFADLPVPAGVLDTLEDRKTLAPANGLHVRNNDVLIARERARKVGKKKGVALCNFSRADVAYIAHFLSSRKSFLLNGLFFDQQSEMPFSEDLAFLSADQKIHWLFLLNSEAAGVMRYDGLENMMWLSGNPEQVMVFRSFTSLRLNPEVPFVFAQRLYSQYWQEVSSETRLPQTRFFFGKKGIVFGVYALNTRSTPCLLQFEIAALRGEDVAQVAAKLASWTVLSNRAIAEGFRFHQLADRLFVEIPLDPNSAGHVLELGPKDGLPIAASAFAEQPELVTGKDALYALRNLRLTPRSVESRVSFPVTRE
jgi:hypothetical protein